ncbi:hypothetical protein [Lysinibacillus sp. G4S2]|uniref:hypothetical protein n=1 Tax=Lysinibacillus sp. G4S2 TaxID=3055859 RepID=UPI0025A04B3C|nr:hypothetical protein [Lysinibacillus sp. G4S2]MDM5245749.1 hypothetical protein [Lysinibacillus sp. G4S2]
MDKSNVTIKPDRPVTSKKYLANCCMKNPNHQMFKVTDGARCVECNGLVNVKEVTMDEHYSLPTYTELHKSRNEKPSKSLSISVDMNTDKMQLKLRAIEKHVGALADELDAIDNTEPCDRCGCIKTETHTLYSSKTTYETMRCSECGLKISEEEFPNRLEGSD